MSTYLGPVGSLVAMPDNGTLKRVMAIPTSVHEIAGTKGGRVVDRVGAVKSTWTADLEGLTQDELSTWQAMALGAYGPGPFVLLDPWAQNLLSANQASGTDVLADTTGFKAAAGTITSSTTQADQGQRSLAWAVTAANQEVLTGNSATITVSSSTVDIPVLPNTVYSARVRGRLSASTGTARLDMRWFDKAEAFISESTGTATALSTAAFTDMPCANITSPSTAALLRLKVRNTVMGAAQTIYLDAWQLATGATNPTWTVGIGVPRVSFTEGFEQEYSVYPYVNGSVTLVEV